DFASRWWFAAMPWPGLTSNTPVGVHRLQWRDRAGFPPASESTIAMPRLRAMPLAGQCLGETMRIIITRPLFGSPEWSAAVALRRAVLRVPLQLDYSAGDLAAEAGDTLFAATEGGRTVGVVMLRPDGPESAKLRQLAVAEEMRGRRIGEQL